MGSNARKILFVLLLASVAVNIVLLARGRIPGYRSGNPAEPPAEAGNKPPGRWHAVDRQPGGQDMRSAIEKLESIGYVTGSTAAPEAMNVTVHDDTSAYSGLNLYTSGHAPEAILMDMQGTVLHTWQYAFNKAWPDRQIPGETTGHQYWRRIHLFENGDLLAIFEGLGLIKIDKDSNLLWKYPAGAHHDLFVAEDGTIYVLIREISMYNGKPILEDFVALLNPDGVEIKRVSIVKCIENSLFAPLLANNSTEGDFLHTNTIEVLDGRLASRSPAFRQGNVLVSFLYYNTIGVLDIEAEKMVWALSGMWRFQHQPTIMPNGNMLIFDNLGLGERSRVLELDPFTQQVYWEYSGTDHQPLYSENCASCAVLPNGNILISETTRGRALEVTPDKRVVWEFISPWRTGKDNELIASLLEMIRLPADFASAWLEK
ncbi:MAG: hypothetical protein FJ119_11170 [Deltaproteobacteria bacterium]|nr:hypothetical protein [Deltaproteobacteria bacterium]